MIAAIARTDACPHCGVDMHSCRNCEHWDPDRPDRCCDESFPYAPDLERANFSSRFTPRRTPHPKSGEGADPRARLEGLFSKKPG
jgi:hypothetical protein